MQSLTNLSIPVENGWEIGPEGLLEPAGIINEINDLVSLPDALAIFDLPLSCFEEALIEDNGLEIYNIIGDVRFFILDDVIELFGQWHETLFILEPGYPQYLSEIAIN